MLGEPMRTQFDWNFKLFDFPIRISAWFWLAALLIGQGASSGNPQYMLVWIAVVFVSILIHELGHAFAFRYYGVSAQIVLYHFGGLAIPNSIGSVWGQSDRTHDPRNHIVISAAGPGLQILSAVALAIVLKVGGYQVPFELLERLIPLPGDTPIPSELITVSVIFYMYVSVFWALLNLLPVYPLDGGQIARDLFVLFGGADALPRSLMLSTFAAGAVALYSFMKIQEPFLGIMFAFLGYSSYQALQAYTGGYRRG